MYKTVCIVHIWSLLINGEKWQTQVNAMLQMHRFTGLVCYDVLIFNCWCSQKLCMPQSCKDSEKPLSLWSTRIAYIRECILDLHLFSNNFKLRAILLHYRCISYALNWLLWDFKNTAGSISKMTNKVKKKKKGQNRFSVKEKRSDLLLQRASVLRNYLYRMKKSIDRPDKIQDAMLCGSTRNKAQKSWKWHLKPKLFSMKVRWGFLSFYL